MPRRLLCLALVAVVLASGAGCADRVSPAVRVGDARISVDDLLAEVAEWVGNQATSFYKEPGAATVTYPMEAVDSLLQQRIELELHNQEFKRLKLTLNDDLRKQVLDQLFQGDTATANQALGGFSNEYAKSYIDDIARQIAVQTELGEVGYNAWRAKVLADVDIEVNPRYGEWDTASGTVVGPKGPAQPAGAALVPAAS